MERLPLIWVLQNQLTFLKALLFVMMDLTGEVKSQFLLLRRKKNLKSKSIFSILKMLQQVVTCVACQNSAGALYIPLWFV